MQKSDCIFCRIATGAIPSLRILDTPDSFAFLDVGPLAPGHALLIPKQHSESILDVPEDVLHAVTAHLSPLARAIMRATGATGMNVLQNTGESGGQLVLHLHFHLIPRRSGDNLGFRWNARKYSAGEGEAVQTAILNELRS
ncbi:MAG TPA: HIT family protein [Phycisphaerae bacterium]|nr:HIT family protein [Phycisphaerae bacterium]